MAFKPGDLVMLKSGGERMTVTAIDADNAVCIWQEKIKGKPTVERKATYPLIALVSGVRSVGIVRLGRT